MTVAERVYRDQPRAPHFDMEAIKRSHPLHSVVERTVKLTKTGSEWKGLCPFHNEKTPSFTIYADDRRWHCHGACAEGGDVLDFVMRRDGVDLPAAAAILDGQRAQSERAAEPKAGHAVYLRPGQRIVATYEYRTHDRLLYRKHRVEPGRDRDKDFAFDHPDGKGGWAAKRSADAIPYLLPAIEAAAHDAMLYMAEGERKADKLAQWGLLATSHRDWTAQFGPYVDGRRVIILPDNDAAGETYASKAADMIRAAGGDPLVIRLPELPEGGDIMDWAGSAEDLARLVAAEIPADLMQSLDLAQLATIRPEPKQFAIQGIAPLAEVTLFTGPGSAGKSLLAQQFATAAAAGMSCLGLDVAAGPSLYLTCEDDAAQLHWRQSHICAKMNAGMARLANRLHLVSLRGALDNELGIFGSDGTLKPTGAYRRLVLKIKTIGASLVFLDNLSHLFTGNENDRGEVTRFVNLLNRLAGETGAAIVLLAHTPKPPRAGEASHDYSGSTAWVNAVRSQFKIDHDRGNGAFQDRDARVLTIGKANYARTGEAMRLLWEDWCFILESDLGPDRAAERADLSNAIGANSAFLACLAERAAQGEGRAVGPSPGPNYAPTQFAGMAAAKGYEREALKLAMDRLFTIGKIESVEVKNKKSGRVAYVLREVPEGSHNYPHNYRTTHSHNPAQPAAQPRTTHTHSPTGNTGVADWPATPDPEDVDWGQSEEVGE